MRRAVTFRDRTRHSARLLSQRYGLDPVTARIQAVKARRKIFDPCEACGERKRLVQDHDHRTGRARGQLCFKCNAIAGCLEHAKRQAVQAYLDERQPIREIHQ